MTNGARCKLEQNDIAGRKRGNQQAEGSGFSGGFVAFASQGVSERLTRGSGLVIIDYKRVTIVTNYRCLCKNLEAGSGEG